MTRYSLKATTREYVKEYVLLSFGRNPANKYGKKQKLWQIKMQKIWKVIWENCFQKVGFKSTELTG